MHTKMTLEELETLIQTARWFEHLGEPLANEGIVQIPTLAPWASLPTDNDELERVADQMEWLPSSRDQDDPIHGTSMEERSAQRGKKDEYSRRSLEIYNRALVSLRGFDGHSALRIGPHDFTEAARGAAIFASRRAVYEILLSECGFWCSVMNFYGQGHWPCGILPNEVVVVF